MKKICFIVIASALILAGCSDEINPANQGNQEELTENSAFLKIRISDVMTGSQTKATAGDFEVSTSEHDVANADFYFYDQAGTFVTKANVWADGQNVSEENGNVEFNGNTVVVLKGLTQKNFPEYLVTVLNGDGRYGQTLNEMEALLSTTDETATDGGFKAGENFIMTTSSYVHSDGTPYFVTKLEEGNFAKDPGNIEKPVTVYVERLAAKVRLSFTENASGAKNPLVPVTIEGLKNTYKMNVTIAGDDNKDEENTEDENPSHIGSEEIVLHFTGWNLNATARKSRLMKNIDTEWAGSKFNFEMSWTDEGNHRSYWGKSYNYDIASYTYPKQGEAALASDALHYVNANEVKEIEEAIYCAENTNTSEIVSANPASAITSAVLYAEVLDGNGKALNLVRFSGLFYEESQYITYVLGNLKKTGKFEYYTKGNTDESGTHYVPVTPADAQIVNIGNGNVNGENSGSQPDADGNSGMGTPPQGMKMPSQDASSGENFTPSDDGMDFPGASMDDSADLEQVTLTQEDAEYLLENMNDISDATISYTTRAGVDGGDLEEETVYSIAGVQANYASLSNLTLSVGEFISEEENGNKEKNCILGAGTAEEIFGSVIEAYGSILYIDQRIYVVDGVLEEMGSVSSGISPDDTIFIPYETGIKYLVGENASPTLTIIAEDVEQIDTVIAEATEVLAESYPNSEFTFSDAGSKMEAASASNQILTMLLIAMAVIVFVVGGIGIMNVLFVSVKERTNEIGILKAIGCSRKNILLEFLLEASAISFLGGVLGIVASLLITPIVQQFDVRVELSATAFLAALGFAVITGTIFGFYPAFKASKLVPVEALNAE